MRTAATLLLLAALAAGGIASAQTSAPAGDAAAGRKTYMALGCYTCHGTMGAGGGSTGPKLAPGPLPYALILRQVRRPAQRMPAYSSRMLPDQQVADIAAYLRGIPPDRPASERAILAR